MNLEDGEGFLKNYETDLEYLTQCEESSEESEDESDEDDDDDLFQVMEDSKCQNFLVHRQIPWVPRSNNQATIEKLETFIEKIHCVLNINTKMRDKLLNEQETLCNILKETVIEKKNLASLMNDNEEEKSESGVLSKAFISQFGMPYFKDSDNFSCLKNNDYIRKKKHGELITHEIESHSWKLDHLKSLRDGVKRCLLDEHKEALKKNIVSMSERDYKKYLDDTSLAEILKNNPDRDFDWMKISAHYATHHSPSECENMWNLYGKSSLQKGQWTNEESEELRNIATKYVWQNWVQIASELSTNRSPLQCFVHFRNRIKIRNSGKWSKKEDDRLKLIVEDCKFGSFIHWPKVSYYMVDRCIQQIYNRWNNNLAPHIKKGSFTSTEDKVIVSGMLQGLQPSEIAAQLGNRCAVQIRERFTTQLKSQLNCKQGDWELEEDLKLLDLTEKYGVSNWSSIAKEFKTRNRTQIRHRYKFLSEKMRDNPDFDVAGLRRLGRKSLNKRVAKTKKMFKTLQTRVNEKIPKRRKRKRTKIKKVVRVKGRGEPARKKAKTTSKNVLPREASRSSSSSSNEDSSSEMSVIKPKRVYSAKVIGVEVLPKDNSLGSRVEKL